MFNKDKVIKASCISAIAIFFLSVFIIYNNSSKSTYTEVYSLSEFTHEDNMEDNNVVTTVLQEEIKDKIFVEVKGEVVNPNVYEVESGSIVRDLIVMAGGLTDRGSLDNINQARELQNGECIVVYSQDELKEGLEESPFVSNEVLSNSTSKGSDSKLVNINTASKDELKTLNGIGDTLAELIISYREENGSFKTIEDIKNVSRIGDKTFEKFKEKIKV